METIKTPNYMVCSFSEWTRNGLPFLTEASATTQGLFEQGRVHTSVYDDLYTYERNYVVKMLTKELYKWR